MLEESDSDTHRTRGVLFNLSARSYRIFNTRWKNRLFYWTDLRPDGSFSVEGENPQLGQDLKLMIRLLRINSPTLQIHVCTKEGCRHEKEDVVTSLPLSNGT